MNDDQNTPDGQPQGEIVLTTVPDTVQDQAPNETPTDLRYCINSICLVHQPPA